MCTTRNTIRNTADRCSIPAILEPKTYQTIEMKRDSRISLRGTVMPILLRIASSSTASDIPADGAVGLTASGISERSCSCFCTLKVQVLKDDWTEGVTAQLASGTLSPRQSRPAESVGAWITLTVAGPINPRIPVPWLPRCESRSSRVCRPLQKQSLSR